MAALSTCSASLDALVVPRSFSEADDQKRSECVAAYEVELTRLKEALTDLFSSRDPSSSEWRGLVVQSVVVLPAHCGRHEWTNERTRTTAKGVMSQVAIRSGCRSVQELLAGREEGGVADGPSSPYTPLHDSSDKGLSVDCTAESDEERWSETAPGKTEHTTPGHVTGSSSNPPGHVTGSSSDPSGHVTGNSSDTPMGGLAVGGVLREVLPLLCKSLTRDTWKEHPSHKHSLVWCLRHLTHPHFGGPRLHLFLPPLLMFVDDYEPYHKTLALRGLTHLIRNVNPTELRWQGRAMVIFEAVRSLLYTSDEDIVHALHPCLLRLLPILEGPPLSKLDTPKSRTVTDEVFDTYLNTLDTESKHAQMKSLTSHLCGYIELLGVGVVRHLPRLLRTLYHCLEWPDHAGEGTRQNCLRALQEVIRGAWPRVPGHRDDIFKCLLKLIVDCCHGDSGTLPESNKPELVILHLTVDCLVLLQRACGDLQPFMDTLEKDTTHDGLRYTIERWREKLKNN